MTASAPPTPTSAPATPIDPRFKLALLALLMVADRIEVAIGGVESAVAHGSGQMYRDPSDLIQDVNVLCQLAVAQDWGLTA